MNKVAEIDALSVIKKYSILATVSPAITSGTTVYYVSESGNDNNSGTEYAPFKTVDKVNSVISENNTVNTVVCFKRGEIFRGQLLARNNVTYTAYGEGKKPVLTISPENGADQSKWSLVSGTDNIWRYADDMSDVGALFFDDGESYAVKRCPDIVNGQYSYGIDELRNLQFMSILPVAQAVNLNNSTAPGILGKVYLRCDAGNPGTVFSSIEFAKRQYVISLPSNGENITIDNLCVRYGGAHGIGGSSLTNLKVQNCEIGYIGGGIQHYTQKAGDATTYIPTCYGNGIEVNTSCDGYTVENCWIHDIYDAGITHQQGENHTVELAFNNVIYRNNLIENCTYSIEYFAKKSSNNKSVKMKDILISDNIMRNAGIGFCEQRTLLSNGWNVAAHIMGWNNASNYAENFVIQNNIFDRCIYSNPVARVNSSFIFVAADNTEWLPEFKGNTYVHYLNSAFCYYGVVVDGGFSAENFTKFTENVNVYDCLKDATATVCVLSY